MLKVMMPPLVPELLTPEDAVDPLLPVPELALAVEPLPDPVDEPVAPFAELVPDAVPLEVPAVGEPLPPELLVPPLLLQAAPRIATVDNHRTKVM